jgi:secondary thiamine-phosphate synthase enzyme
MGMASMLELCGGEIVPSHSLARTGVRPRCPGLSLLAYTDPMPSTTLMIPTRRDKQALDITDHLEQYLAGSGVIDGLCSLFMAHTTAALTTGEAIEGTDQDLMETLERMIPAIRFRHAHDPSHAPDHMISSIVGCSLTIPVRGGKLLLGTWQRVLLIECNGPRDRDVAITVIPA